MSAPDPRHLQRQWDEDAARARLSRIRRESARPAPSSWSIFLTLVAVAIYSLFLCPAIAGAVQ